MIIHTVFSSYTSNCVTILTFASEIKLVSFVSYPQGFIFQIDVQ